MIEVSPQEKLMRWQDFAIRMARTCFSKRTSPDQEWIEQEVEGFFDWFPSEDINLFISWDETKPYPPGHKYHGVEWDGRQASPPYVCDIVMEMFDKIWSKPWDYATPKEICLLNYYDDRCDYETFDELREKIVDRWESPVHCCIRAGMDVALSPSAGVLGFTVGDIRAMYRDGIPQWFQDLWQSEAGDEVMFDKLPGKSGLWL